MGFFLHSTCIFGESPARFSLTEEAIITKPLDRKSDFLSIATDPENTAETSRIFHF